VAGGYNMTRRAGPEDLLETAARVLREQVVHELSGKARYQALMVANAIAIAARQIGETPSQYPADMPAAADARAFFDSVETEKRRKALFEKARPVREASDRNEKRPRALVQAIREGTLDGRADVFDWIVGRLRAEVGVSNPKALARESVDDVHR
jgi:hypothetical protein